jgi:2-polyprenyl-6-methoxyphenol hydroxylase-like FAD-dependent oxidoreductase
MSDLRVQCCIAGGGPAGMMLGYLLARAGVSVAVVEKHGDFLRDFRGDTVHPSTLEVMHELGLLDAFLKLPHEKVERLAAQFGDATYNIADFSRLNVAAPFVAFMPQWDFLNFLAERAKALPAFKLLMPAKAKGLIESEGIIKGVVAKTDEGSLRIAADLVVAADGRSSAVREVAGLTPVSYGAPMDVFWFRLSRKPGDPLTTMGRFDRGRIFVLLNRGDYWQCAYVIPKGKADELRAAGVESFWDGLLNVMPALRNRKSEIRSVDDLKLLSVQIDRLPTWHKPGLLVIGDAAHAMSPVGGVGINLAIQDAVATANLLWAPLKSGAVTSADLARVQKRREFPTRITQRLQIVMQNAIIGPALKGDAPVRAPLLVHLFDRFPRLRRIPARVMGLGVRPEHVAAAIRRPSLAA